MRSLLVVDANSIARQLFSKGTSQVALRTMRTINRLRVDFNIEQVVVCFDGLEGRLRRQAIYPKYKATRPETPKNFIQDIKELFFAVRERVQDPWSIEVHRTYEADDFIAEVVRRASIDDTWVTYIFTRDHDSHALLRGKQVMRVELNDGLFSVVTEQKVFDRVGVRSYQWADYRALSGDSSDEIAGVPGIGPKNARLLLEQYGTLDKILEDLESLEITEKRRVALRESVGSGELERMRQVLAFIPVEAKWQRPDMVLDSIFGVTV